ncbi:MAG: Regulatory protein RecX [Candidatus Beckwithbacteria bacterium GW2011_GWA2_43_10]|uniref:Regulatory protein RecX n=1 Tax=Candidatus Beckwithbacteria bacterium GW2011_GWA2_43_10 TaxID=1618369 RepID=A0A0G1C3C4_9BACT|nr:MAG: Regulatory protein RecX [Candidatus Beckwithbacteria bacterium GW2011_GWA2_43_10]
MALVSTFEYLTAKALRLLSYRPRSIREIKRRLIRTNADTKTINRVIADLIDQNMLNDQEFAKWWVDQRVKFRPRGNYALTRELAQKGIDREIIDSVLLSFDAELELAKKLPASKRPSRGFSFPVIDALSAKE